MNKSLVAYLQLDERRCLVPASSFCEPRVERPAVWHLFALKGEDPSPLFVFPGVWRRYRGPLKKGGDTVELEVFAFMTTLPTAQNIANRSLKVCLGGRTALALSTQTSRGRAYYVLTDEVSAGALLR